MPSSASTMVKMGDQVVLRVTDAPAILVEKP
jgi:hypothetical protein